MSLRSVSRHGQRRDDRGTPMASVAMRDGRTRAPLVASALLLAVLVGVCVALVGPVDEGQALLILTAIAAASPFVVGGLRREFDIFEPVYLFAVSFAVLFVFRPAVELAGADGPQPIAGKDPGPNYTAAMIVALLGALAFYLGYYADVARKLVANARAPNEDFDPRSLKLYVSTVACVGLALFGAFLLQSGGVSALSAILAGRSQATTDLYAQAVGYFYTGPFWLGGLGLLLLALAKTWGSRQGVVGLLLVAISQVTTIATGSRSWVLPMAASVIVLWYLRARRRPSLRLIALMAIPAFVVGFSAPREFRSTGDVSFVDAVSADVVDLPGAVERFLLGADAAMLPNLALEMTVVPQVIPFQLGWTYVEAVGRPIPRAIWPDKPPPGDTVLTAAIWPRLAANRVGFSFSVFGEPYMNLGHVGVVLFGIAFGVAWRYLYEYRRLLESSRIVNAVFALSWPFMFVYMRGGVAVDYQRQVILVLPVLAATWLVTRRPTREGGIGLVADGGRSGRDGTSEKKHGSSLTASGGGQ